MSRLLRVELRRLLSRRLFKLVMLALFLGIAGILVFQGVRSSRNLAAARASAAAQAKANDTPPPALQTYCAQRGTPLVVVTRPPIVRGSESGPVIVGPGSNGPCTFVAPPPQVFYSDPRFSFADSAANALAIAVTAVSLLGFVVGAGFVGAEWAAGTFSLLLTWEPRRIRVLVAKLAAVVAVFVVVGVLAIALVLGGTWLIASTRGTTAGTTATLETLLRWRALRGLALIALLTGAGTAIAGLTRHTAMALVTFIAYLVVFELFLRRLYPGWERWLVTSNAGALLTGSVRLFPPQRRYVRFGTPTSYLLHADRAALYLVGLFLVLALAWAFALVRRDVDESGR